ASHKHLGMTCRLSPEAACARAELDAVKRWIPEDEAEIEPARRLLEIVRSQDSTKKAIEEAPELPPDVVRRILQRVDLGRADDIGRLLEHTITRVERALKQRSGLIYMGVAEPLVRVGRLYGRHLERAFNGWTLTASSAPVMLNAHEPPDPRRRGPRDVGLGVRGRNQLVVATPR